MPLVEGHYIRVAWASDVRAKSNGSSAIVCFSTSIWLHKQPIRHFSQCQETCKAQRVVRQDGQDRNQGQNRKVEQQGMGHQIVQK